MKIIIVVACIVLVSGFCFAGDQEGNLKWIENNIDSIFDSLKINEVASLEDTKIEIGAVQGEQAGFIKNKIIKFLDKNKRQDTGKQPIDKIFRVEQFATEIVYHENSYGFLNLQTGFQRENHINFNGWIEDESGKILISIKVNKTIADSLFIDNIPEIEKSPYSFTRGRTKNLALWNKVVEPVLVSGTVGLMVYLLFTVRS